MQNKIHNFKIFIGIEPTTREIILNPPKEKAYIEKQKEVVNLEKQIRENIDKIFSSEDANSFWKTTEKNSDKFDEAANKNAEESLNNDLFWKSKTTLNKEIHSIIITEEYRQKEYERSEYFNDNSEIITMGSFHYIQFEKPTEIAKIIKSSIDKYNN
ncbi:hypothetical protein GCM10022297_15090 [Lactobacillus hamsteri]|uniref:Uncharacterized protein n=1 Tax=Lactobacillus hamsteri DSM 5661 = JCM 6256 TaxID=1423754 RepID=A0A0R1YC92_9LACO|nr:hypothetical protein [Lactobacillus hamsteri]KRM40135.1 hypothetical protein FC39_GL000872 [Lactobacillus hamsteri DSM 5661 = JCM 6256]